MSIEVGVFSLFDIHKRDFADHVILVIANKLQELCRESDIIARWGGEEFVILLPGTTLDGAQVLAENLRKIVEESHFSIAGKITASFGVGIHQNNESKTDFFKRIDKLLYEAKKRGRNRVIS